jgi:hypothetical protein
MPWIVTDSGIRIELTHDEAGNYIANIHIHLMSPENAMKTEGSLKVFVREMLA